MKEKCRLCGNGYRLKTIDYCIDCLSEIICDAHKITVLINDGHPHHCAIRQVLGDGECECGLYVDRRE